MVRTHSFPGDIIISVRAPPPWPEHHPLQHSLLKELNLNKPYPKPQHPLWLLHGCTSCFCRSFLCTTSSGNGLQSSDLSLWSLPGKASPASLPTFCSGPSLLHPVCLLRPLVTACDYPVQCVDRCLLYWNEGSLDQSPFLVLSCISMITCLHVFGIRITNKGLLQYLYFFFTEIFSFFGI